MSSPRKVPPTQAKRQAKGGENGTVEEAVAPDPEKLPQFFVVERAVIEACLQIVLQLPTGQYLRIQEQLGLNLIEKLMNPQPVHAPKRRAGGRAK